MKEGGAPHVMGVHLVMWSTLYIIECTHLYNRGTPFVEVSMYIHICILEDTPYAIGGKCF